MSRLEWDLTGDRFFETGVDRGVLYPSEGPGVSWVGIISVGNGISGSSYNSFYLDGVKLSDQIENGNTKFSINAFSTPKEFLPCVGDVSLLNGLYVTKQNKREFGFSYRTRVGNDVLGIDLGFKIHLIYRSVVESQKITHNTINQNVDLDEFSLSIDTIPFYKTIRKPTAHIIFDSTKLSSTIINSIQDVLYGTTTTEARLPTQGEIDDWLGV